MEASKIIDVENGLNFIYNYADDIPNKNVWSTEYEDGQVRFLRKVVEIEEESCNYQTTKFYDKFGCETSNVDWDYDVDDYKFYRVNYEVIDLLNENEYGGIRPYSEVDRIFVEKLLSYDSYKFESDVAELANEIQEVYGIDDDQYYGDCYPSDIDEIRSNIIYDSSHVMLLAPKYRDYMTDVRNVFDSYARSYLDNND